MPDVHSCLMTKGAQGDVNQRDKDGQRARGKHQSTLNAGGAGTDTSSAPAQRAAKDT
jgi:hypothetical protein